MESHCQSDAPAMWQVKRSDYSATKNLEFDAFLIDKLSVR
jgi:hypothetical protein